MQEFEIVKDNELSVTGRVVTDRIPTNLVEEEIAKQLEESYQRGQIEGIETTYSVGSRVTNSVPVQEYEYNGKKYVRVKAEFSTNENNLRFSNGNEIIFGQTYWLHVEPLTKVMESNQAFVAVIGSNESYSVKKPTTISKFLEDYMNPGKTSDQNKEWRPSDIELESQRPLPPFENLKDTKTQFIDKLPEQSPVSDFMEFSKDYVDLNKENNQDLKSK